MAAIPTLRFPGDGLDFRRPAPAPVFHDIIDLTDDTSPVNGRRQPRMNTQVNPTFATLRNRTHRPPSELIDVDEDSTSATINTARLSPDLELVEVRTIRSHPTNEAESAPRQGVRAESPRSNLRPLDSSNSYRREAPFTIGGWGALRQHARGRERPHGSTQQSAHHSRHHLHSENIMPPGLLHRTHEYRLPGDLDFVSQGFQMGDVAGVRQAQPPLPTYDTPSPARQGYTRSPKEHDALICPNCEEELGMGNSEDKRQVWVVKACGHVRASASTQSQVSAYQDI
ncbi:MAG: hypothetical protein Q9218_000884 [Villophora microphyllina]